MPGERFLDIATGTGWTARRLAARGASVVGIDLGAPVIEAAKTLAPTIDFRVGDAESLEFEDESFDGVTSTFGIMFSARPEDAASELTRVCKRGGRIGLATWLPGGTVEAFFNVMRPYLPPPPSPAPPSPLEWGRSERVRALLGTAFDLKFETGTTTLRVPSTSLHKLANVWSRISSCYRHSRASGGPGQLLEPFGPGCPLSRA